ncbi:hypothetical protein AcetOrient_orf00062 [Acetobacter orientalis]|uniref:Uncharacterized protein n=1 Tax=Acetobacter orientalis TaxID=146474 RepID=A0A2Z5ZD07_9PROT|nr:hypothetical protein AcetOrient_orf00062 [Acetobacter orientalis]
MLAKTSKTIPLKIAAYYRQFSYPLSKTLPKARKLPKTHAPKCAL